MPLHFLSAIYNIEISLKEAEISQRKIEKKIEELKFDDRPKNEKEKEINGVLMQANDLFEYRDKIINAFFFFFFFYLGFLSQTFTIHGTAGEVGGYLFNSSLPLPPASHTLRH